MYAIIYWKEYKEGEKYLCYPVLDFKNSKNPDALWTFETLAEADIEAELFESRNGYDCRVITIDSVHE